MKAVDRFLKYVKTNTISSTTSTTVPTTQSQIAFGKFLAQELQDMGISNVIHTDTGYVYAKIPATIGCENAPPLGFIAHMDTAPAFSGENITPIIHENYNGEDISLPFNNIVISKSGFHFLQKMKGKTVVTANGKTLLGADDKAGIAEIITMCQELLQNNTPHGTVCVGFTPDEEVGAGADHFDVDTFGAKYAYTMDGDAVGCIEYENFNAASVEINIKGVSVHPGSAKNILVNALLLACYIQNALPATQVPEKTEGYEGFFFLESFSGDSTQAKMSYIIRDHDENKFNEKKLLIKNITQAVQNANPTAEIKISIKDSYFNMKAQIASCMHLIDNAKQAAKSAGIEPFVKAIRGGTDGARLSYRGLPCPNLGTGGQNFHGPYEIIAAEDMDLAVQMMLNIVEIYSEQII